MKRRLIILALTIFSLSFAGCEKEPFSYYALTVPYESWTGAMNETEWSIMASFLISEGFIGSFIIESSDVAANDAEAIRRFHEYVDRLKKFDLADVMVGANRPGTLNFTYALATGSEEGKIIAFETISFSY